MLSEENAEIVANLNEALEALLDAKNVVQERVDTEHYLEKQAILAGHYSPDPNNTHKSAAGLALAKINAVLAKRS